MSKIVDILDVLFETKKRESGKMKEAIKNNKNCSSAKILDAEFYAMKNSLTSKKTLDK